MQAIQSAKEAARILSFHQSRQDINFRGGRHPGSAPTTVNDEWIASRNYEARCTIATFNIRMPVCHRRGLQKACNVHLATETLSYSVLYDGWTAVQIRSYLLARCALGLACQADAPVAVHWPLPFTMDAYCMLCPRASKLHRNAHKCDDAQIEIKALIGAVRGFPADSRLPEATLLDMVKRHAEHRIAVKHGGNERQAMLKYDNISCNLLDTVMCSCTLVFEFNRTCSLKVVPRV